MGTLLIVTFLTGILHTLPFLCCANGQPSCGIGQSVKRACFATESFNNGFCVKKCPIGFHRNINGFCHSCPSACTSCDTNGCLACHESKYLSKHGLCKDSCDKNTLKKSSGSRRVRLVKGSSSLEGVVEVYYNGLWGTICADSWSSQTANVLCKELNLGTAVENKIVHQNRFKRVDGFKENRIWLSMVQCTGKEDTIFDCKHKDWEKNDCGHLEDVAIRCSGPDMTRKCVTKCGDGFYISNTTNVMCQPCHLDCKTCTSLEQCQSCHEMRFLQGTSCVANCPPGKYGNKKSWKCQPCPSRCATCKMIGDDVKCTSCFTDSETPYLFLDNCVASCPGTVVNEKHIRLKGNYSTPYEGLLEVRYRGVWHTVCDDHFTINTARVFCKELGYGQPIRFEGSIYGQGTGAILARGVSCRGNETSFIQCHQAEWLTPGCDHLEDIGLWCRPPPHGIQMNDNCVAKCPDGTFLNDTVCQLCNRVCLTCKDDPENCVTCRKGLFFSKSKCVLKCPWGTYADAKQHACLSCAKPCRSCVEKADKCLSCTGLLLHNGTHCVKECPENFYQKEFICVRNCGFKHYAKDKDKKCHACPFKCLLCNATGTCHACEYDHVLTTEGKCKRQCQSGEYRLPMDTELPGYKQILRLTSVEGFKAKGRLEILHDGIWGTICDDLWLTGNASQVACRQLLLGPPKRKLYMRSRSAPQLRRSRTWLDDVKCNGSEDSLSDCKRSKWGEHNCHSIEDVHIECTYPGISTCVPKCPKSYYQESGVCIPCSAKCLNCSGTAHNCSSCKSGYFRSKDNQCLRNCSIGYYGKHGLCMKCDKSCATCNGPLYTECTSCTRPKILHGVMCVDGCPLHTFERDVNPNIQLAHKTGPYEGVIMMRVGRIKGLLCDRYPTIQDGEVLCRELHLGKVLEVSQRMIWPGYFDLKPLKNPVCFGNESSILQCRQYRHQYCSGRYTLAVKCSGPDTSNRCIKNCKSEKGVYVNKTRCSFCSNLCLRCANNATFCTACPKGKIQTWDHKCVDYCHTGTYYSIVSKMCEKCDLTKCVACTYFDVCTICAGGKSNAMPGGCVKNCPPTQYYQEGLHNVRLTEKYLDYSPTKTRSSGIVEILLKKEWRAVCHAGFSIREAAVLCHQLGYGDPQDFKPAYISIYRLDNPEKITLNCTGHELSVSHCSQTVERCRYNVVKLECSHYSPLHRCVKSCYPGFYVAGKECRRCSSQCLTCKGSASTCTSCNVTRVLYQSKCINTCGDGLFVHLGKMKCERCSDKCKTCLDGYTDDRCTSCDDPYFLRDTKCVETCYPDHTLLDLMPPQKSTVQLVNGSSPREGFVRFSRNGEWGILCAGDSQGYIFNLVCQELGYQKSVGFTLKTYNGYNVQMFYGSCYSNAKSFSECRMHDSSDCPRPSFVTCSSELIDKRMCRKKNSERCTPGVCFERVPCVNGNNRLLTAEESFCRHCPPGFYGDGIQCTSIARSPPSYVYVYRRIVKRTLFLGRYVSFYCSANSDGVQIRSTRHNWFKDGKPFTTGKVLHGSLRFRIDSYSYAGIYTCVLKNSVGSLNHTYNITIRGKPLIVRADNVDVVHEQPVLLTCDVSAQPPANISWKFGNITIGEKRSRDGGSRVLANGSLYIPQPILKDAGNYRCIVSNVYGNTSAVVRLRVGDELGFERKPGVIIVSLGDSARFKCTPFSESSNLWSLVWRRRGKTLKPDEKYEITEESLIVHDVSKEDCGEYYCVVKDKYRIITSLGTLIIKNEPPCIHTVPQNLALQSGMYARFYCGVSGDPVPKITWVNRKGSVLSHTEVLQIENVNISHVDVFKCIASIGENTTVAVAFLSVDGYHSCPYIFTTPKDHVAVFGKVSSFYCSGAAYTNYNLYWYKDGKKILNGGKYTLTDRNRKLIINKVNNDDIGSYKCVVESQGETDSAISYLKTANVQQLAGSTSSPNVAGIVIGVLMCLLVIIIILYFVRRYRRHGASPVDVLRDVKRKTLSRFQSSTKHTVLKYDTAEYHHDAGDDDVYDNSDTNPFVRD